MVVELYILTNRTASHLTAARNWLKANGILEILKGVLSSAERSKAVVCYEHGIEVLLDDDFRGEFDHSCLKVVTFAPNPENSPTPDFFTVHSWREFAEFVAAGCRPPAK